jgi:LmbE family N-acetylglucosaminyl deacetylase
MKIKKTITGEPCEQEPRSGLIRRFRQKCWHFQLCTIVLALLIVCVSTVIGVEVFNMRSSNLAEMRVGLPQWRLDGPKDRVLIIAPHSDDEILGCGGLIKRLKTRGVPVKVVLTTTGDGFHVAAARLFHNYSVTPKLYVKFGYVRQQESLAGLAKLGVPKEDVIFFGYPDRGLAHMWLEHWKPGNPFRSAYTKVTSTPYEDAFHPHAEYCGSTVLGDFKKLISDYKPTTIYYTHSDDQHQDHWAINCYVTQALYELGLLKKVRSGLYIVHRGDWPVPQGLHTCDPLSPPISLKGLGTKWYELDLTNADEDAKLDAIMEYKTQMITKRFLTSFVRTNEIFGTYSPGTIGRLSPIGGVNDLAWAKAFPCILDPIGDNLKVDVAPDGDLRELRCCYDDQYFYMRLGLAHSYSNSLFYHLYIHSIPDSTSKSLNIRVHGHSCNIPGAKVSVGLDAVAVAVPISRIGKWNAVMVCADAYFRSVEVDRISWRLLTPRKD